MTPPRRAVVIGASLGGLLAARVASEFVDEVLILERGQLPQGFEHRRATPHTVHAHGLLAGGANLLEQLFPGLHAEWLEAGGTPGDVLLNTRFYANGQAFRRAESGLTGFAVGRTVIEGTVRRRVMSLPQVRAREGVHVSGLGLEGSRVGGVWLEDERGKPRGEFIAADWVIDASGRGSQLPQWLRSLGFEAPTEERIAMDVRYATVYFRRSPGQLEQDGVPSAVVACAATPAQPRPGVIIAQEGERWVMSLGGYGVDAPPLTREGFRQRAIAQGPEFAELVQRCEWLSEPVSYRMPHSQRRHYQRLARFPQGLLALGDSLCSFNPIFGQGMSVLARQALALQDFLAADRPQAWRRYYRGSAKAIDAAWATACGADLALAHVPGPRPLAVRLIGRYVAQVFKAAVHDVEVARAFTEVSHLLREPAWLLRPGIVARVTWQALRRPRPAAAQAQWVS